MTMQHYDPEVAPDPQAWLALDEAIRVGWIRNFHDKAALRTPALDTHVALHATVENQIAMGLSYVADACTRLMAEGLSRHDALHAIAAVLTAYMTELVEEKAEPVLALARYRANCERMSAESWLAWLEEEEE